MPVRPAAPPPHQRSFDELATPLHQVTFCVVDLETTGGSPGEDAITEIGAVKLRGGERLGTFQTLVNPGRLIPPSITVLTGITQAMVVPAPRVETVLPAWLEFAGDAVLVGHNLRFDTGFLDAALRRAGRPVHTQRRVDTVALARRLVREEVPDCRLSTLADRLRLPHRPRHRALDDALTTADLLHHLLERAAAFGVVGLDDLLSLPTMAGHAQSAKLRLTTRLPRTPGVYLFRDAGGRTLYVGKATNLRSRVRSYFSTDDRRKIGPLLRETQRVDHVETASALEAAVLELRLIQRLLPHYNRQGTRWPKQVWLKLTAEPYPRLAVARSRRADGGFYVGPLPSARVARLVADAVETASSLRRCTAPARPGRPLRDAPCAPAQLGVTACPCTGDLDPRRYEAEVDRVRRGLTTDPGLLLGPLRQRMLALAAGERFEEAAEIRDRAEALATALQRQRRVAALRASGRVDLLLPGGLAVTLQGGRLVTDHLADLWAGPDDERAVTDELVVVAAWLDANAARVRLVGCDGFLASAVPRVPPLRPVPPPPPPPPSAVSSSAWASSSRSS
jgi:DNA polymerase-3 subunit epsilon